MIMGRAKKSVETRRDQAIEARQNRIADLLATFMPQWKIAEVLELDKSTVSRDVAAIREEWKRQNVESFERFKAQLEKGFEIVAQKAWIEYERSKKPKHTTKKSETPDGTFNQEITEERCGDPRYLNVIINALNSMADRILPKDLPNVLVDVKLPVVPIQVNSREEAQNYQKMVSSLNGNGQAHANGNGKH